MTHLYRYGNFIKFLTPTKFLEGNILRNPSQGVVAVADPGGFRGLGPLTLNNVISFSDVLAPHSLLHSHWQCWTPLSKILDSLLGSANMTFLCRPDHFMQFLTKKNVWQFTPTSIPPHGVEDLYVCISIQIWTFHSIHSKTFLGELTSSSLPYPMGEGFGKMASV